MTYNGLLDPLGESQILPYLRECRPFLKQLTVISFEKVERFKVGGAAKTEELAAMGVRWIPLRFTSRHGRLGKILDLLKMYLSVYRATLGGSVDFIHYRGANTAQVGTLLHRLPGVRMVLDMRSFWADQRLDGGLWDLARRSDRWLYRYSKWVERRLLRQADQVVVLTHRAVPELEKLAPGCGARTTVIPCCADFKHFRVLSAQRKAEVRRSLGIPEDALLVGYLGSLGTWYMLDEMLQLFALIRQEVPSAQMMLVSQDWDPGCEAAIERAGLTNARADILVRAAERREVPELVGACDVMLAFYKPGYSHIATSPTKFAEAAACGVPTICNYGVGDMVDLIRDLQAGAMVDACNTDEMRTIARSVRQIAARGGDGLRARAQPQLSLEAGAHKYLAVYRAVGPQE